jgi:hypothetical protein
MRIRYRLTLALAIVLALALAVSLGQARASVGTGSQVVVPRGQPVQIAVVLDESPPISTLYSQGIRNAVQMALRLHSSVRGFPIQLNDNFDGPCFGDDNVAVNAAAADAVVSNTQNVAVIGHICSQAFAAGATCPKPAPTTALSIYEAQAITTINGSATAPCNASVGPTVFNGTAVPGTAFDGWYSLVKKLPSDRLWQQTYQLLFGVAPTDFADLYFDATNLLLTRLQQTSTVAGGKLVINRAALAKAVRNTTNFPGVTCTVSLDQTGYRINDNAALGRCAGTGYDHISGSGQRAGFGTPTAYTPTFTIDASSGPSGENSQGTMTIDWGTSWVDPPYSGAPYSTTVNVTNLCVTGNTATIVGIISGGTPNATIGDPLVTVIRDLGKPTGGASPDKMLGVFSGGTYFPGYFPNQDPVVLASICANPYEPNGPEPADPSRFLGLLSGNINVTDATP